MSDKVYQRKNGSFYVKADEFVRSEAGQQLLERFIRAQEKEEKRKSSDNGRDDATDKSSSPSR